MLKKFGLILLASLMPLSLQAADFQEGVHYAKLTQPVRTADPARVEVVEMFGYPCPHCNSFEPLLEHWQKAKSDEVNFVRVPVVFGRSWEPLARAYYTSELMKTLDKTHQATFDAIHVQRERLGSQDAIADLYGKLGVDASKFNKMYDSFAVNMKMKQGDSKMRGYGVTGVPSMVVNGKYRVTAQMAGGHKEMLEVVDYLVKLESAAKE